MSARQNVATGIGRAARRSRFLRRRLRRRDRAKYIDMLAGCGIFDLDYYSLQAGETFSSVLEAASDYVYQGQHFGHSPNPFFEGRDLAAPHDHPDMPPFVWFLSRPRRLARKTANPLWDVHAYTAEHPDARRHRYGPLGHLWERLTPETIIDIRGLEGITQRPWSEVRAVIEQSAGQWALQSRLGSEVRFTSDESVVALTHVTAKVTRQTPPSSHPLVSIVMPTWNRADRLRTAIDSVLAQSSDNWELIVANDGSTDDTAIVLDLLSSRDPRIRSLDLPHRGVSAARNSALQVAQGTYVAFLDSDNTWQPEFVETMAKEMQRRDVDAAFCTIKRIRDRNSDFRMFEGTRDHLLQGNFIDLNALVVSRDLIGSVGGFDEDLRRCVDFDLALRIAEHEDIQHVPYVGVEYADSFEDDTRISVTEPLAWSSLVRQKHEIDWPAEQQKSRVAGRTSIVLPLLGSYARHADLFDEIRAFADSNDVELILVGLSVERLTWTKMTALSLAGLSVETMLYDRRESFGYAVNRALGLVTGDDVIVLDSSHKITALDLEALRSALHAPDVAIVQPLDMRPTGTIANAGAVITPFTSYPVALLADHPVEDVQARGNLPFPVPAVASRTFAVRTSEIVSVRGFDPLLHNSPDVSDLSLRITALRPGTCAVVVPTIVAHQAVFAGRLWKSPRRENFSVFVDRHRSDLTATEPDFWDPFKLRFDHWGYEHLDKRPARMSRAGADLHRAWKQDIPIALPEARLSLPRATLSVSESAPSLRWAIKTASPAGPDGESWGDTHFARSLAKSLTMLGQQVVVDTRPSVDRSTTYLDDVNLVLRGLLDVAPPPAACSIFWLISHPDQVTPKEIKQYDAAFAASTSWARDKSDQWGVPIEPLLQCTDPHLFHPPSEALTHRGRTLFVGNSRGVPRISVVGPVAAGIDVAVYGQGWDDFLPEGIVEGEYVDNAEVHKLYGAASLVLNDHWDDMREEGFISNRLFDVVASGGRVLSDTVEGIEEIFAGSVRQYGSSEELLDLLSSPSNDLFPSEEAMAKTARSIAELHSFEARAKTLLDKAISLRASR